MGTIKYAHKKDKDDYVLYIDEQSKTKIISLYTINKLLEEEIIIFHYEVNQENLFIEEVEFKVILNLLLGLHDYLKFEDFEKVGK